ncbi:MAG TPA: hypothetical protein VFA79_10615 [Myxococcales bacterium]|nr:hypothetical protein [Myxococcales bacterium]
MKFAATLPFLVFATLISAAHGDVASGALAGHWRGVFGDGPAETVIEVQFDQSAGGYRGHFWSAVPAGTSLQVSDVEVGRSVRFAVPPIGVFEGEIRGDILMGTVSGQSAGPFRLRKEPGPEDLNFVG